MLFGSSVAMCFGRKEDRKKNNSAGKPPSTVKGRIPAENRMERGRSFG